MNEPTTTGGPPGNRRTRWLIIGLVAASVVGTLLLRWQREQKTFVAASQAVVSQAGSPRLIELGSTSCAPCKAMHEELAHLRTECGASIGVEEIDVWKDDEAAVRYGVSVIPTQVFLDASGKEIDRHIGFLARADIRARFADKGLECRP